MAITTIGQDNSKVQTILTYLLGIAGVALIVFFGGELVRNYQKNKNLSGLTVTAYYGQFDVFVNDENIGKTPIESKPIKSGQNKLTLKNETRSYETSIKFSPKSKSEIKVVALIRDLGANETFSSGIDTWFEEDKSENVLRVLSEPSGASVLIDGTEVGKTPYSSNTVSEGAYDIRISLAGFEDQAIRANIRKEITLNINAKLYPLPFGQKIAKLPDSPNVYDLSTDNPIVNSNPEAWVNGLIHWISTRGVDLEDKKGITENPFDYFFDHRGNVYDKTGVQITKPEEFSKLKDAVSGAYLGRVSDGGLTKEAKDTLQALLGATGDVKKVKIKSTPTGWLRVRDSANLNGKEITRVNVGTEYEVVEEQTGWVKIKVSNDIQGWVSSDYVEVVEAIVVKPAI